MASSAEMTAMRRAVVIASASLGTSNPNPSVGAVVLDSAGGQVSEGVTSPAGGPHAEVVALQAAGERARGATLVVTLEPCRHVGRTGPCTEAIIASGVARVVFAAADPTGDSGGGAEILRERGVEVESGVLADEVGPYLEPWLVAVGRGRPFVTWKYAATLDGRTAATDGTSRWITGSDARLDVQRERRRSDAIVVGIGTVLVDDPSLTVRDVLTTRPPLRVVVDSDARTPTTAAVLDDAAPTLVATCDDAAPDRIEALRHSPAEVVTLPRTSGRVDLAALLQELHDRESHIVLLEGGATLAAGFLHAGIVDRTVGYYAPAVLGAGTPVLGDLGIETIAAAKRFATQQVDLVGQDIRIVTRIDGSAKGSEN
jgi:diaminohydroxyphosphoribosylaminopyrimidine deaminase / 5-amino-6-(5-phosphoribosylamino)uracil reductase